MKLQERIILHCDANNFFASCECIDKPHLKDKPVAVSGNPKTRTGIILAKNEIAKKYGVSTGEAIWQAVQKCPDLVCLPPHHEKYQIISDKIKQIYLDYTDKVESFGIDECWLDVTASQKLFGNGEQIAFQIKERVKKEIGLTISVGVSFCKIFAKLGSDLKKPDAITTITREDYKQKTYHLKLTDIIGFGKRVSKTLASAGIYTVGDFCQAPTEYIQRKMGKTGVELKEKLTGYDFDPVISTPPLPKSIGNGTTTVIDIQSREEISSTIAFLCDKIACRLRKQNLFCLTIGVTLKTNDFQYFHHDTKMQYHTNNSAVLHEQALALVDSFWLYNQKIRAVRVRTSTLKQGCEKAQQSIFENLKTNPLGYGIDKLRLKYGKNIVTLASNLNNDYINNEEE